MKKFLALLSLMGLASFSSLALAECPDNLKAYEFECQLYEKYQGLRTEFNKIDVDIENIGFHRSGRLINSKHLEQSPDKVSRPWEFYGDATWKLWEKGNDAREEMNEQIQNKVEHNKNEMREPYITIKDISRLHQQAISSNNSDIKTKLGIYVPGATVLYNSADNFPVSEEELARLKNYEIKSVIDGKPLIKVLFSKKNKDGTHQVTISYNKSSSAKDDLSNIADMVNTYFQKHNSVIKKAGHDQYPYNLSPIAFSAYIQKYFVSIHPFNEGEGRLSRYLQDLILSYFHLPSIAGGRLQNDLTTPMNDYIEQNKISFENELEKLEFCLKNYQMSFGGAKAELADECREVFHIYPENTPEEKKSIEEFNQYFGNKKHLPKINKDLLSCNHNSFSYKFEKFLKGMKKINLAIRGAFSPKLSISTDQTNTNIILGGKNTEERKRKILEAASTPLVEDLKLYTWTPDSKNYFGTQLKANVAPLRNHLLDSKSEDHNKAGKGIYASLNLYDSAHYGSLDEYTCKVNISSKNPDQINKNQLPALTKHEGKYYSLALIEEKIEKKELKIKLALQNPLSSIDFSKEVEKELDKDLCVFIKNNSGHDHKTLKDDDKIKQNKAYLSQITVKKGENFLDLKNDEVVARLFEIYKKNGLFVPKEKLTKDNKKKIFEDVKLLNPNAIIRYPNKGFENEQWFVLKNRGLTSLSSHQVEANKLSPKEMNDIYKGFLLTSNRTDSSFVNPALNTLGDLVEKSEKVWEKTIAPKLTVDEQEPYWTPFGKCVFRKNKRLEYVDIKRCEDSAAPRNRLIVEYVKPVNDNEFTIRKNLEGTVIDVKLHKKAKNAKKDAKNIKSDIHKEIIERKIFNEASEEQKFEKVLSDYDFNPKLPKNTLKKIKQDSANFWQSEDGLELMLRIIKIGIDYSHQKTFINSKMVEALSTKDAMNAFYKELENKDLSDVVRNTLNQILETKIIQLRNKHSGEKYIKQLTFEESSLAKSDKKFLHHLKQAAYLDEKEKFLLEKALNYRNSSK